VISFDSTAAHDTTAALPGVAGRDAPAPVNGSVLGRYLVIEELGKGGMGLVVRAYDPKLQREVALKMLRHEVMSEAARIRMIREARAMAKLNHPNVVAIYDVSLEDDAIALAMEFVRGATLREWLRDSKPRVDEIVEAFVQAGRGLAAAHAEGLLHRDFKPANVLVTTLEDGRLRVKVTDFGIARVDSLPDVPVVTDNDMSDLLLRSDDTGTGALTEAGTVMGTPRYMAPEQHCGDALGPALDQFAFCVALWEAIAGEAPYVGDAMIAKKRAGPPPWPRGVVAPAGVVTAIRRGLAPAPDDRWPDMTSLLRALTAHRKRGRSWFSMAALASAVGLTGAGWATLGDRDAQRCTGAESQLAEIWDASRRADVESALLSANAAYGPALWERIGPRLDAYTEAWVATHVDACMATSVRGEQSTAVLDLRMACLHRSKRDLQAALSLLDHADADVLRKAHVLVDELPDLSRCADIDALQADVPPPPPHEAEAVAHVETIVAEAKALLVAGKLDAADAAMQRAEAELQDISYAPVATAVLQVRGTIFSELGKYAESEVALRQTIASAGRAGQWSALAEAGGELASIIALEQARPAEALVYMEVAQIMADRSHDPSLVAALHNQRGTVLYSEGKYAEAETEMRTAIELLVRTHGPEDSTAPGIRNNLAIVLHHLGKYAEAEAEHYAVLNSREAELGPEHPELATTHHNLAATLNAEAKPDEAIAHYREALRIWEQALGKDHPQVFKSRNNLGNVLNGQGRFEEAEVILRDVVRAWSADLGADHPEVATSRTNHANALLGLSRFDEAEAEYRAVLRIHEAHRDATHPDVAHAHYNIANLCATTKRHAEAEAEYRTAVALWTELLGADHDDPLMARSLLAGELSAQGRHAEAQTELQAVLPGLEAKMGVDHPHVATTRRRLAMAWAGLDRLDDAEAELRRAVDILDRQHATHPDLADTRLAFGSFLRERGQLEPAGVQLEKAWSAVRDGTRAPVRGAAAFELARLSWTKGERSRARTLASEAERAYEAAGPPWENERATVRQWLRAPE
jgi:serine/threonine protein kinase/Tfp pilus assembly protein PilF